MKILRYLIPFWKLEVSMIGLAVARIFLEVANPYLAKFIIDKAYVQRDLKLFIILAVLSVTVFLCIEICVALQKYTSQHINQHIKFMLTVRLFRKMQSLPYGFFQNTASGENIYKINYDIEQVARGVADTLPQILTLVFKSLLIFFIIFHLNWKIALLSLTLIPLLAVVSYFFTNKLKKFHSQWVQGAQNMLVRLHEVLSHIQLIKSFGKQTWEIKVFSSAAMQNLKLALRNMRLEAVMSCSINAVSRFIPGVVMFYGGYELIMGRMSLGSLGAIALYLNQLSGLQGSCAYLFPQKTFSFISRERIDSILNSRSEDGEKERNNKILFARGRIEFKEVAFGYASETPLRGGSPLGRKNVVLEQLSFSIKERSFVALVGSSGCGKTTIANLVLRLYDPAHGQILIDECPLQHISSQSLYPQVGIALQESFLWNDSVSNNIRYGKEDATTREIRESAMVACIDEFITVLPQGYETAVGENACKISEGQKQRIAIARAIIKKPKILILDEALSCVDAQLEEKIIDNIRNFLPESTIILISHRVSIMQRVDKVYFLESPSHMAIGTHEQLMASNALYRAYLAQSS